MPSDHDSSGNKVSVPKHGRAPSSAGSTSSSSSSSCNPPPTQKGSVDGTSRKPTGQKRRRRAPSPSLWVPWSLRTFNLTCEEFYRSSPVPLPPVRKSLPKEERDSWDENVASRPYHPVEWRGVLPGPGLGHGLGLGGKDVRNINFGANGGIMLGRVLVFWIGGILGFMMLNDCDDFWMKDTYHLLLSALAQSEYQISCTRS